jgi:hypothetical protein
MKNFFIIALLSLFMSGCTNDIAPVEVQNPTPALPKVTNFDECIAVGNSIMESYPAECAHNGITFVEEVEAPTPKSIICPMVHKPVCGNDDETYGNECFAQAVGVKYEGACKNLENKTTNSTISKNCTSWYDGCNNCIVKGGEIQGCTKRACVHQGTPKCLEFADTETNTGLKNCPETKIVNRMPMVIDPRQEPPINSYFILDGARRELSEFDLSWVESSCEVFIQEVF